LIAGAQVFTDSKDILKYLDTITPETTKLYPSAPELLKQVEELEALFNTQLGTATPTWEYSYTLHNPKLAKRRFIYGVPFHEQALFPLIFPLISSTIRRQINVTTEATTNAHAQITQIFEAVGNLLADGRTYLVGDRFSAADLTFAALSTAAVRPPEYGDAELALSNLEQLPPKLAQEVRVFREMPAGAFALRLWRSRTAVS